MQQQLFVNRQGEGALREKEDLTKLYKQKYKELGKILEDAKIPSETVRAIRELSVYYKHLSMIGDIDIDKIKIKYKNKNKGYGMRFCIRSEADYKRLKETYGQISDVSFNSKLLIEKTYGKNQNSDTVL